MRSTRLQHCLFFFLLLSALSAQGAISTLIIEQAVERLQLPPIAEDQTYRIQNAVVGHRYAIQLAGYDQQAYQISHINGGHIEQGGDFYQVFIATDPLPTFRLVRRAGWNQPTPFRITIANLSALEEHRVAQGGGRSSPILVDRNSNAQQLVNAIFRNNDCFATSNQVFTGVSGFWPPAGDTLSQLGTFSNGSASIGIDEGVVLTNGRTSEIGQANTASFTGYSYSLQPSNIQDPDLLILSGEVPLYDVAILEFDFTPTTDFINFDYVFASDEYCELQNVFNDVFAFLISGPGINGPFSNGAENIAVLPDGTPISTRSINDGNNAALFRSNSVEGGSDFCSGPPSAIEYIEFDGFTVPLTASAQVIPCETYHLKLILADVNDSFIHSAVFFQRGSFATDLVTPAAPAATAEDNGIPNAPLEGCSDGYIVLTRIDSNSTEDATVYFNISPASTATFGVDYTMPIDSFVIPAGQLSDTLFVTIFPDDEVEGTETVILQILGTCSCEQNEAILYIVDPPALQLDLPESSTDCLGTSLTIAPEVSGGVGDYRFQWSDGSADSLASFTRLAGEQTYYLSVTDNCRQTVVDSILLSAPDISASLAGTYRLCASSSARVPILLSGGTNYSVTITENDVSRSIELSNTDTLWLNYSLATLITLDSVSADGCGGNVQGSALVENAVFDVQAELNHINCFGDSSGAIFVDVNGQPEDYSFQWQQAGLQGFNPQQLAAGSYHLRIIDSAACFFDTSFLLTQPSQALRIDTLAITPQDCRQAASLAVAIEGGTAPYTFSWSDGNNTDLNRENLLGGQVYTLQASDANGCLSSSDFETIDNSSQIPVSILRPDSVLSCSTTSLSLTASTNYASPLLYRWINSAGDTVGTANNLLVQQPGNLTLLLRDPGNGCTSSTSQQITQNIDTLVLTAADTYVLNCLQDSVDLLVDIGNFQGQVDYTWRDTAGNLLGNTSSLAHVNRPGSYLLEVLRGDNGCLSRMALAVGEDRRLPIFEILQPRPLSCLVNPAPARAILEESGQYTFDWTTSNGQIEGHTDQDSILLSSAGAYSLLVRNTENGCSQVATFTAAEDRRTVVADAGDDRLIPCDASNFQVIGLASPSLEGTAYRWLNEEGEEVSNTALLNTLRPGRYTLLLTHPVSGCTSSDELLLSSNGPQALSISPELSPCPEIGGAVVLGEPIGGTPPYRYFLDGEAVSLMSSPNEPTNNSRLSGLAEGFHTIRVEDANACGLQDTFQIFERLPFEGLAEDISVRLGQEVVLGVSSNRDNEIFSYRWEGYPGLSCVHCPNPTAAPFESFRAFVELTDLAGCRLRLAQSVFVDRRELVYAPTAFSPRKPDGFNDRFTLYGDDRFVVQINYLRIFDRWGALLFERENFLVSEESEGWDGYHRGQLLSTNTYVFVAEVQLWDGTKEIVKGSFHLMP